MPPTHRPLATPRSYDLDAHPATWRGARWLLRWAVATRAPGGGGRRRAPAPQLRMTRASARVRLGWSRRLSFVNLCEEPEVLGPGVSFNSGLGLWLFNRSSVLSNNFANGVTLYVSGAAECVPLWRVSLLPQGGSVVVCGLTQRSTKLALVQRRVWDFASVWTPWRGLEPNYRAYQMSRSTKASEAEAHAQVQRRMCARALGGAAAQARQATVGVFMWLKVMQTALFPQREACSAGGPTEQLAHGSSRTPDGTNCLKARPGRVQHRGHALPSACGGVPTRPVGRLRGAWSPATGRVSGVRACHWAILGGAAGGGPACSSPGVAVSRPTSHAHGVHGRWAECRRLLGTCSLLSRSCAAQRVEADAGGARRICCCRHARRAVWEQTLVVHGAYPQSFTTVRLVTPHAVLVSHSKKGGDSNNLTLRVSASRCTCHDAPALSAGGTTALLLGGGAPAPVTGLWRSRRW